jgi:hypothetical protein
LGGILSRPAVGHEQEDRCDHADKRDEQREELE